MTSVWPAGCVCQCDRAPGLNSTWPPVALLYLFAGNTGVTTTWPENVSAEPTVDGREPFAETCIVSAAAEVAITIASGNATLSKRLILSPFYRSRRESRGSTSLLDLKLVRGPAFDQTV